MRRAGRTSRLALALAMAARATLAVSAASACNVCLEDKIAATYDWQVVTAAQREGHTVVFGAIKGPIAPDDSALGRRLVRDLSMTRGVDAGTVRVSLSPPAVSFVCDLERGGAGELLARMNRRLRSSGLQLALVRVGAPGGSGARAVGTRVERAEIGPVVVASTRAQHRARHSRVAP